MSEIDLRIQKDVEGLAIRYIGLDKLEKIKDKYSNETMYIQLDDELEE